MKMKHTLTLMLILALSACNKDFMIIYCGPNKTNPRLIHRKNPFEYVNEKKQLTLKLIADSIETIQASPGVEFKRKKEITQLIDSLNQYNITYNQSLRALYISFVANPCDSAIHNRYINAVERMDKERTEIEKLKITILSTLKSKGFGGSSLGEIKEILEKYLNKLKQ